MAVTTEEFITHFHSLDGITIGEKRKNLFILLNNIQDLQIIDVSTIQPRNPLEESFKTEILIRYKKVPELIEVLKCGNPILIGRILKVSSWILEEFLKHVEDEEAFIELIFPFLSFNAKTKLINKLAVYLKNPQKADRIFNAINKKYGSYLASKLLPCCSKELIVNCLKISKIELTSRQLLIIIERNLAETENILNALMVYHSKETIQTKYKTIFKYIAKTDLLLFLKLYKVFKPCMRLGWRSTGNIIFQDKELVVKNSKQLYKVFHKKQTAKSLSNDFDEFYFDLLPSLTEFKSNINFYLELKIPTKLSKLNLVLTTFEKKYSMRLLEQPELITPGLLELMSIDERDIWINSNEKPKHFNEESWICLMKIEKSLPVLKKKISLTSDVKERAELVGCLVETCRINKDMSALTSVLKYILMHHRNDASSVLYCFMNTIKKSFPVEDLLEEHWKYLNEIVQIFIIRKEIPFYYFEWFYTYINFRMLKGLPIKSELKNLSEKHGLDAIACSTYLKTRNFEKQFLIAYGEIIPEIDVPEYASIEMRYMGFLQAITKWNKKHPKDRISLVPYKNVFDIFIKFLNMEEHRYQFSASCITEIFREFYACLDFDESNINLFLDNLFKDKYFCNEMKLVDWLIRCHPLVLLQYMDLIINYIIDLWYTLLTPFFWIHCRNYHHLEIPQKIIAICLSVLNSNDKNDMKKRNSVMALSYLMSSEDFLELIKSYYPSDGIIDVNKEESQETYKIQQAITVNLKNVIPQTNVIESILEFTIGDYLKYIQRSLYSVSHSAPETNLVNFFKLLSNYPVSVRKHAIYLGFKVLDKSEICKILELMEHEENSSIRKFLFKSSFNYFCKNPYEEFSWEVAKKYMMLVDIDDKEVLDILININQVPKTRLMDYFMFTWEFLDTHISNQETAFVTAKIALLNCLDLKAFADLPKILSLGIIEKYFFKFEHHIDFQKAIICFAVKSLIYSTSETDQQEYFRSITEGLKKCIELFDWKKPEVKKVISFFVKEFCDPFRKKLSLNNYLVKQMLVFWNELLKPYQAFDEYLCLNLTLLFSNLTVTEISVKLAEFCNNLLGVYGMAVADLFSASLKFHISDFLNAIDEDGSDLKDTTLLTLLENIIQFSNSVNCLMMVISLLPKSITGTPMVKKKYREIMKVLEDSSDLRVQVCLSMHLESFEIDKLDDFEYEGLKDSRRGRSWCPTYIVEYNSKYMK